MVIISFTEAVITGPGTCCTGAATRPALSLTDVEYHVQGQSYCLDHSDAINRLYSVYSYWPSEV